MNGTHHLADVVKRFREAQTFRGTLTRKRAPVRASAVKDFAEARRVLEAASQAMDAPPSALPWL